MWREPSLLGYMAQDLLTIRGYYVTSKMAPVTLKKNVFLKNLPRIAATCYHFYVP